MDFLLKLKNLCKNISEEEIITMGKELIGIEIMLHRNCPYEKVTITRVNGIKEVSDHRFVELIGTCENSTLSILISIRTYIKLYNKTRIFKIDENDEIYVKEVEKNQ